MTQSRATTVTVRSDPTYEVRVGSGVLGEVKEFAQAYSRACILTDENVEPLWADALDLNGVARLVVPAGEDSKRFAACESVLEQMIEAGLDRSSVLLALGGGVVGDLGGLCASLFLRGIDWIACPTSLLAQVDSSVGGKTGVNLKHGKNLAGTFHPPARVFADLRTLKTLPEAEIHSGLGEVAKAAVIEGRALWALLEDHAAGLLQLEEGALQVVVAACIQSKARIVAEDTKESGLRKALNLGHTFGHALEQVLGPGTIPHGVAVAAGLGAAARASAAIGLLEDDSLPARVDAMLSHLNLPHGASELRAAGHTWDDAAFLEAMKSDKK
ncbi:MAG: 3-dehydroquinate synthase family protein, partial [Planctomycetota bacterium]